MFSALDDPFFDEKALIMNVKQMLNDECNYFTKME